MRTQSGHLGWDATLMKDQVNKQANVRIPGVSLSVIDEENVKGVEEKTRTKKLLQAIKV